MVRSFVFRAAPPAPRGNIFNWAGLVGRFSMGVIPRASWIFRAELGAFPNRIRPKSWPPIFGPETLLRNILRVFLELGMCRRAFGRSCQMAGVSLSDQTITEHTVPLNMFFAPGPRPWLGGCRHPSPLPAGLLGGGSLPTGRGGGRLPSRICMSSWPRGVQCA
jgi:hypothetical protein